MQATAERSAAGVQLLDLVEALRNNALTQQEAADHLIELGAYLADEMLRFDELADGSSVRDYRDGVDRVLGALQALQDASAMLYEFIDSRQAHLLGTITSMADAAEDELYDGRCLLESVASLTSLYAAVER